MTGGTVTGSDVVGRAGSGQASAPSPGPSPTDPGTATGTDSGGATSSGTVPGGAASGGAAPGGTSATAPPAPSPALSPSAEWPGPKSEIRRRLLALRRAGVTPDSAVLTERVLALPEVARARCVAAYVGMADEPDTAELLARLRARGVRILLPVVRPDLDLDFREYGTTLVPGAMGTREPPPSAPLVELARADAVIVPALAVDQAGNRLGRGGGSYDRALARTAPSTPVIALVHDREILTDVPAEEHDRRVTVIVTPSRTLRPASS
ncbi:5-formyltetrahydrofolate cyclo-ligase [Parafrankia irregularis]|uniref:5-formyltetrahydrofolate cyclo-ligase n=1 Tax=Parafrankia irregularis TaxID=795642 RepID=UPI0030FEDB06